MYNRAKYKAHTEKDWTELPDPVASKKRDGGNFWVSIDSEGVPSYISRRPSVKGGFPDRTASLPHLSFKVPELAGHIINVELVHTGHSRLGKDSHSTVSGILNSLAPRAIQTQATIGPVRASMFNVLNPEFSTFKEKLEYLKKVEQLVGKPDVFFVEPHVEGRSAIEALIKQTKDAGHEGVIITSSTKHESDNTRIKVKHLDTYNLLISNIIQERDKDGNPKESMGALELTDATGRVVGYVGTGFSRADRIDAWSNPDKWKGELGQVKTMGPARNALRMPVWNGFADGQIDRVPL